MRDDGGPAFPFWGYVAGSSEKAPLAGMSLRDWLAGQAVVGILTAANVPAGDWPRCAAHAYAAADAMLAEREKE